MTILRPSHLAAPLPLLLAGALLLAACAGVTPGPAATLSPAPPPGLRPGQALTRALPAGGSDELRLALPAAAYVRIQVDQTEVDVAVRLLDPQGRTVATADGPETAVPSLPSRQEDRDLLLRVLGRVSRDCRDLWRQILLGLSYHEMSLRLGVAEGTLRVRVLRCREKAVALRAELLEGPPTQIRNNAVRKTPNPSGGSDL